MVRLQSFRPHCLQCGQEFSPANIAGDVGWNWVMFCSSACAEKYHTFRARAKRMLSLLRRPRQALQRWKERESCMQCNTRLALLGFEGESRVFVCPSCMAFYLISDSTESEGSDDSGGQA